MQDRSDDRIVLARRDLDSVRPSLSHASSSAAEVVVMSNFAKLLLVATSFAPVLLTLAFVDWRRGEPFWYPSCYLIAAAMLTVVCALVLREASRRLEVLRLPIESVKPADKEIVGFVLSYLLPLINTWNVARVDVWVLWFVIAILFMIVWTSNAYHFNPLLGLGGYHFYEVTTQNKISFILISRQDVRQASSIGEVVQLTEYMILERKKCQ